MKRRLTQAQILLAKHLRELYKVEPVFEYRLTPNRKFAFDVYVQGWGTGFECDGGQWSGGHMRGIKIEAQYEKDRLAQIMGYRIFRFTNRQILSGEAKTWLKEHL